MAASRWATPSAVTLTDVAGGDGHSAQDVIPIVLCIDAEPDARIVESTAPPWRGLPLTFERLERERTRLERVSDRPVHLNWFVRMDPQVAAVHGSASWAVEQHRALFSRAVRAGDAVGLHTHSWRWDPALTAWVSDFSDPAWIDECLDLSFTAFEQAMGRRCTVFRFGDRWMDDRTMGQLEARGVEVDLTLEPGFDAVSFYGSGEIARGVLPDYRPVPTVPFVPALRDYRLAGAPGERRLRELPITTATVQPNRAHRLYSRWVSGKPVSSRSTALLSLSSSVFTRVIDEALRRPRPHLVLTLRTGAAAVPRHAARIEANLAILRTRPEASRFAWVTPEEALARLV